MITVGTTVVSGSPINGGGGGGLPVATGAGEVPVSTGAGTTYAASPFSTEVGTAVGGFIGGVAGQAFIGDGGGGVGLTSADVSDFLAAANAAAARASIGVGGTTLGHLWERPAPDSVALGSTFISSDDLTEQVSSGVVVSPATITSGWMQRIPSGIGAGRAAISGGAGQPRIFATSLDLSPYTVDQTTFAVLYTWDGTQPVSYGISEVAMIGDYNNNNRGIHIWYVTNGGDTDLAAVTNGAATVLVTSANLLAGAAGLHALVVAPVTVGPLQYFRFSYDGSVVADVPLPVLSPYVAPNTSDAIALGSRGDGLVYLNGQAIELAVWGGTALSSADILALATLPATPTYELPESASTGAAQILVAVSRYDPRTSATTMPARGVSKPLTVSSAVTKVTL